MRLCLGLVLVQGRAWVSAVCAHGGEQIEAGWWAPACVPYLRYAQRFPEPRSSSSSSSSHHTPARPCSKSFLTAIDLLVELASLQTAFLTLDEAIKTTNRRVNALEHVVKPRLENTIAYIKVGCRCSSFLGWVGLGRWSTRWSESNEAPTATATNRHTNQPIAQPTNRAG